MEDGVVLKVEQSDRDAAASLHCGIEKDQVLRGKRDHGRDVQAFAAYREAIMERAAKIALNPGFIQARDDAWDTGFNDAKRIIAHEIRKHGDTHDQG